MSKDFGASGFRTGCLHIRSTALKSAISRMMLAFCQGPLANVGNAMILRDTVFVNKYLA